MIFNLPSYRPLSHHSTCRVVCPGFMFGARSGTLSSESLYPHLLKLFTKSPKHLSFNHGVEGSSPSSAMRPAHHAHSAVGRRPQGAGKGHPPCPRPVHASHFRDSPCTTLGRPLVSPGFAGCMMPGNPGHRSAGQLRSSRGVYESGGAGAVAHAAGDIHVLLGSFQIS